MVHSRSSYLYALVYTIERAAFYGIRGLLVFFIIKSLQFEEEKAYAIYGYFLPASAICLVLGGLVGDIVTGNRNAIFLGGILQFAGILLFLFNSELFLYIGLGLILIGSGFFSSNLKAQFGKIYFTKPQLADSGFTLLWLSINIGAIIGTSIIVELGVLKFKYGFILAASLYLLAAILGLLVKEDLDNSEMVKNHRAGLGMKNILAYLFLIVIIYSLYQILFNLSSRISYEYKMDYIIRNTSSNNILVMVIPNILSFISGIILYVFWAKKYIDQFWKFSIGFLLISLSLLALNFFPGNEASSISELVLLSIIFLMLAEVIIWPAVHSAITKYAPPKFMATAFGIVILPTLVIPESILNIFLNEGNQSSHLVISIGFSISILVAVLLLVLRKKRQMLKSEDE